MPVSKLYKNGNSTVVVIPSWVTVNLNLKPGDGIEFFLLRGADYKVHPFAFFTISTTHEKPKASTKR